MPKFDASLRERITRHLAGFERHALASESLRPAAVAIVIVPAEDSHEACFLLTKRASQLRRHRGQWALPGGRTDPGEVAVGGALRELREEVGLGLGESEVLGLLDDYPTRSGYAISPVVLWGGSDPRLKRDPGEVAAIYRVPVGDLARSDVPRLHRIAESERPVLSIVFESLGREIFAPTAAMLYQLHEVGLEGRATRVDHFEQPLFAWR